VANPQQTVGTSETQVVGPAPAHGRELRQVDAVVEDLSERREAMRALHRMHAQLRKAKPHVYSRRQFEAERTEKWEDGKKLTCKAASSINQELPSGALETIATFKMHNTC